MAAFLILSLFHFSRDLNGTTPKVIRLLYAGSVIVLPTLFNFDEMRNLFSLILDDKAGLEIVTFLHLLTWPWLIALVIGMVFEFTKHWLLGLELLAVCLLAIFARPLISFTIFFCTMHSLRHILRTQTYANMSLRQLAVISLAPMLGLAFMLILGWNYLPDSPNFERILQFIFVTLAALTFPHMLLIDRVKYQN